MSETPRKLGRYELIRRIAVGGMGEIYLARVHGTAGFEKTVIIKTILSHLAREDEFVEKFLDEGRIVVNLTHGNIVPVFDMDEVDGEYFIAMDYVPGRDLRDALKRLRERDETMPADLAAYLVSEVCEGLGYAHRKTDDEGNSLDIVHRDVSPSNILISTDGEVKIIDFGIARAADRRAQTISGRIQGKCCYMSPEQARGESLDHRSDIFSTGVVFYEMLTGIRPFEGDSDLKSLELVRTCEFEPPSEVNEAIPDPLDTIVERALAEDPEERYQEIHRMKVDLMEFLVSRGRAVTSEEVAEFLKELFPEGLEREAFREVREEADEPSGPLGLDDALERQIDEHVDPLDETLPEEVDDAERIDGREQTRTLPPQSGGDEAGADASGSDESIGPTPLDRPGEREEAREAPSEIETEESGDGGGSVRGWAGVVVLVLAIVGAGALWRTLRPTTGTLVVRTTPEAATVEVDGELRDETRTPAEFELSAGEHTLVLAREGYESARRRVDLEAGGREELSAELSEEAEAESDTPEIRRFVVRSQPTNARLWADRKELGRAPQPIEVKRDEMTFVEAKKEGCRPARTPVYYGHEGKVITVRLDCTEGSEASSEDSDEGEGSEDEASAASSSNPSERAGPRPDPRVEVEFRSWPPGAKVFVGEKVLGVTPVRQSFRRRETLEVRFEKSGYETVEQTARVGEIEDGVLRAELDERKMGCLNFFAIEPQYNRLAIDGEWLDGRRQKLEDYRLPVGEHQIRVQNPEAERDETFSFEVEDGDSCTTLTVWDPDDG